LLSNQKDGNLILHRPKKNPSLEIVQLLSKRGFSNFRVVCCTFPVVRTICFSKLQTVLETVRPVGVVALGQGRGPSIALERIAINIDDYRVSDNEGSRIVDEKIVCAVPTAYCSSTVGEITITGG
jgi:pyroglutamyl-peptidase